MTHCNFEKETIAATGVKKGKMLGNRSILQRKEEPQNRVFYKTSVIIEKNIQKK